MMNQVVTGSQNPRALRILVVDDDPDIVSTSKAAFERAGYEVWGVGSADEAMRCLEDRGIPHLAIIDINMPGTDGVALARRIKERCDLPIVMLTAVTESSTVVASLEEFAEDYITKPVELQELVARAGRILRRIRDFSYAVDPVVQVDQRLAIEFTRCRAMVDGERVRLTPIESKLLHILMRDAGRTVRTQYLIHRLWPVEEVFEDALRVHVHRLRRKIERDPKKPDYVVTVRGTGYKFPSLGTLNRSKSGAGGLEGAHPKPVAPLDAG